MRSSPDRQLLELGPELFRQRAVKLHRIPGSGMNEPEPCRVKTLALEARDRLLGSVDCVTENWMAQAGHMNPDLMRPAGFQAAAEMGVAGKVFQHLPIGDGGAAVGQHRHFFPICGVAANGEIGRAHV